MRADAGFRTQRFQGLWFFVMLVDRMADAADEFKTRIGGCGLMRMTAATGAKAGLFRRLG